MVSYRFSPTTKDIGNRVLVPETFLKRIEKTGVSFPLFLSLTYEDRVVYCGIFEFHSGRNVLIPPHIVQKLGNPKAGQRIQLEIVQLPNCAMITLRPHEQKFMTLNDPKFLLESELSRMYPCISQGDVLRIQCEDLEYLFDVMKTLPEKVVSLVDIDCEVTFDQARDAPPAIPGQYFTGRFYRLMD